MERSSFNKALEFTDKRVKISVILETSFSKEVRIALKKGQQMKEHKASYPIIVHLLKGVIEFGVNNKKYKLEPGAILTLESNVPHDLYALEESVVRLTLSKLDAVERVENVAKIT